MTRLGRKLLGLSPRSSRLDVLGRAIVHLVLFEIGRMGGPESRIVVEVFLLGGGKVVRVLGRVHREAAFVFVGGIGELHIDVVVGGGRDHARQGSVQVVEVGLGAAAAAAVVGSSSAAHGVRADLSDRKSVV